MSGKKNNKDQEESASGVTQEQFLQLMARMEFIEKSVARLENLLTNLPAKHLSVEQVSFLQDVPQQLKDLQAASQSLPAKDLSVENVSFIQDAPQKLKDLQAASQSNLGEARYERQQTATSIDRFRAELENFQQTGHPSFTSTLDKLTSFLQQNSVATESVINKSPTLSDPSCPSFITCYVSFLNYKDKNGFLTFGQILKKTPSILRIFHEKIHFKDSTSYLSLDLADFDLFREVLSKVFYPHCFPVEAFHISYFSQPHGITHYSPIRLFVCSIYQRCYGYP